ncbi:MAG: QueT transporter family protein [Clostridia bacterium]|nr:QueT transporter family protein [Clostridia bacterium]
MKRKALALRLTRGAMIGALYVALTYVATLFSLSSGAIQFRISEMLTILPVFMPEAIVGLFIGCIISNVMAAAIPLDILFGSLATLIGALGAYMLRKLPRVLMWIATLPTILANAIIVPFVLIYAYGAPDAYIYLFATVCLGEVVCAGIGGSILYYSIKRAKIRF